MAPKGSDTIYQDVENVQNNQQNVVEPPAKKQKLDQDDDPKFWKKQYQLLLTQYQSLQEDFSKLKDATKKKDNVAHLALEKLESTVQVLRQQKQTSTTTHVSECNDEDVMLLKQRLAEKDLELLNVKHNEQEVLRQNVTFDRKYQDLKIKHQTLQREETVQRDLVTLYTSLSHIQIIESNPEEVLYKCRYETDKYQFDFVLSSAESGVAYQFVHCTNLQNAEEACANRLPQELQQTQTIDESNMPDLMDKIRNTVKSL